MFPPPQKRSALQISSTRMPNEAHSLRSHGQTMARSSCGASRNDHERDGLTLKLISRTRTTPWLLPLRAKRASRPPQSPSRYIAYAPLTTRWMVNPF